MAICQGTRRVLRSKIFNDFAALFQRRTALRILPRDWNSFAMRMRTCAADKRRSTVSLPCFFLSLPFLFLSPPLTPFLLSSFFFFLLVTVLLDAYLERRSVSRRGTARRKPINFLPTPDDPADLNVIYNPLCIRYSSRRCLASDLRERTEIELAAGRRSFGLENISWRVSDRLGFDLTLFTMCRDVSHGWGWYEYSHSRFPGIRHKNKIHVQLRHCIIQSTHKRKQEALIHIVNFGPHSVVVLSLKYQSVIQLSSIKLKIFRTWRKLTNREKKKKKKKKKSRRRRKRGRRKEGCLISQKMHYTGQRGTRE